MPVIRIGSKYVLGVGMVHIDITEARKVLSETVNRVIYQNERVAICRHGKSVAALVPMDDLKLIEMLEDRLDLEGAREALRERGGKSWEKIKAELGL